MVTMCDDVTAALHVLQLQLSPPLPSSLAPRKLANPASRGKMADKTDRERERERERETETETERETQRERERFADLITLPAWWRKQSKHDDEPL